MKYMQSPKAEISLMCLGKAKETRRAEAEVRADHNVKQKSWNVRPSKPW